MGLKEKLIKLLLQLPLSSPQSQQTAQSLGHPRGRPSVSSSTGFQHSGQFYAPWELATVPFQGIWALAVPSSEKVLPPALFTQMPQ